MCASPRSSLGWRVALAALGLHVTPPSIMQAQSPNDLLAAAREFPSELYVVGKGSCGLEVQATERPACAERRAREEAVLSVRAQVTAVNEQHCRARWTRTSSEGDRNTQTTTQCDISLGGRAEATLELTNTSPVKAWCRETHCHAIIAVERSQLMARVRRQMDAPLAQFGTLIERATRSNDASAALRILRQADALTRTLEESSGLLAAVSATPEDSASYRAAVIKARESILARVHVCIAATSEGKGFVADAVTGLKEAGVRQVEVAPDCASRATTLVLGAVTEVSAPSATVMGMVTVTQTLAISRDDEPRSTVTSAVGRGVASDATRARQQANEQLHRAVGPMTCKRILGDPS